MISRAFTFLSRTCIPVLIACLLLPIQLANAHNNVVVVPLFGNDKQAFANVVTVAKKGGDFTNLISAVASIEDASDDNPYLILVGPGEFVLTQTLELSDGIHLAGSGVGLTRLSIETNGVDTRFSNVILAESNNFGVSNNSISNLTIKVTEGINASPTALVVGSQANVRVDNVMIIVEAFSGGSGISNNGSLQLSNSKIEILDASGTLGSPRAVGVISQSASSRITQIRNSEIVASNESADGVAVISGRLEIKNSVITANGSRDDEQTYGVRLGVSAQKSEIISSKIQASGEQSTGLLVQGDELGKLTVLASEIIGSTPISANTTVSSRPNILMSSSTLGGGRSIQGNARCVFVTNEFLTEWSRDCVLPE